MWPCVRHRDQIALLALRRRGDLVAGIAAGEHRFRRRCPSPRARRDALRCTRGRRCISSLSRRSSCLMLRAAQPSATWISTTDALQMRASSRTCVEDRVVVVASSRAERGCAGTWSARVHASETNVWNSSHMLSAAMTTATRYASTLSHAGFTNSPIFSLFGREHHQREDGERELQAQDHLAEDEQLRRPALAVHDGDDRRPARWR